MIEIAIYIGVYVVGFIIGLFSHPLWSRFFHNIRKYGFKAKKGMVFVGVIAVLALLFYITHYILKDDDVLALVLAGYVMAYLLCDALKEY